MGIAFFATVHRFTLYIGVNPQPSTTLKQGVKLRRNLEFHQHKLYLVVY